MGSISWRTLRRTFSQARLRSARVYAAEPRPDPSRAPALPPPPSPETPLVRADQPSSLLLCVIPLDDNPNSGSTNLPMTSAKRSSRTTSLRARPARRTRCTTTSSSAPVWEVGIPHRGLCFLPSRGDRLWSLDGCRQRVKRLPRGEQWVGPCVTCRVRGLGACSFPSGRALPGGSS